MDNKQSNNNLTLAETFKKYFLVELARTTKQKNKVYTIRYNVYCKEFAYEPIECYPDEKEYDEYDEYSMHSLITHKSSKIPAACVRLVPAFDQGHNLDVKLPFEKYCTESLDMEFINKLDFDPKTKCEVSRLAVDGLFRRRSSETLTRFGAINMKFSEEEQRAFPLLAVATFLLAIGLTELSDKTNMFAMMEPSLYRLLKRFGIVFQKAGKNINYHGIRALYFMTTQSALNNMRSELLELYHCLHKQIKHPEGQPIGYRGIKEKEVYRQIK